jgi:hypothetical protein
MTGLVQAVDLPAQISDAAAKLHQVASNEEILPNEVLAIFDSWAKSLDARELDDLPGIIFLRIWLRRGTLEPIVTRELGPNSLDGEWTEYGRARCRFFPLGVVGHWPAGNVEIQPILSMTCALLGGNAALVRVPARLVDLARIVMEKLAMSDPDERLTRRIFMAAFEHDRRDLHAAMASTVDGAMIWGGQEAVLQVRSLPFPHWARLAVFGPRISVAAMDAGAWSTPDEQKTWCLRMARDLWQFDQQACSSPQVLYLEKKAGHSTAQFLSSLQRAFEAENRAHPRRAIPAALTSTISLARASWLLDAAAGLGNGYSSTGSRQDPHRARSGRSDGCGLEARWKCPDAWLGHDRWRKRESAGSVSRTKRCRPNRQTGSHAYFCFSLGRCRSDPADGSDGPPCSLNGLNTLEMGNSNHEGWRGIS